MDLIADGYLHHLNIDTALILDQALDLQPLPDDERTAFGDPAGDDEYGWSER